MPHIVTSAFKNRSFFIPYARDKSEGFWCRPLTQTKRNELRRQAHLEAGMDTELADAFFARLVLSEQITDWKGFTTPDGAAIPFSRDIIRELCECDAQMAARMLLQILDMARVGELDDEKN